ncbi:MAG: PAS domain S-box protein [Gammaproteobacteria bacterium]|nr:PAS domain S-box protein [Gammaproteobacteria bacterium]MBU3989959.1 PAS domain S-box protein [Gammaproteobacteria bacterium]MBU4004428.1 PAS domain S-box protein [Gammaproteobacteria bacterium]MBU4019837.1 PAS domain S-box protein [Gammaproteobacteria bacterium]MBU4097456.1 PAS domain S-box protein [Gammaproteobacteria bacterium]
MRHNKQIKEQATARMREGKTSLLELAREYGVSTNTLRTWFKDSEARSKAQSSAKRIATALSREKYTSASQRQRLLMHALEQSPATIIVTDAEGKIVYANPKFVETTGYAVTEAIGQNPRLLKSGETSSEDYRQLWKAITGGKEWRGTFHNRRKDGSLYWERASISPVFDAAGKIANFMAVKEDITEYMEAEAARRRSADSFHSVFAALPFAVLVVDAAGCIQLANSAAEIMFGTPQLVAKRLDGLNLRWLDADGVALAADAHPLRMLLRRKTDGDELRMRLGLVPPIGGTRWLNVTIRTLRLPDAEELAVLLVLDEAGGA